MLRVVIDGGIAEIHMDRPPANALNPELVAGLREAHRKIVEQRTRTMLLVGRPGIFSGGLDVPQLLPLGRAAVLDFWRDFFELCKSLATSPAPVIAALTGHSPAGGAVLALHCDYRIAARGNFRIGLNEVAVGLPVPPSIMAALTSVVGIRIAHRITMLAELMPVERALQVGLVDELVEPEQLLVRAREIAASLARLPPIAQERTRSQARADLLDMLDPAREAEFAAEYWFSDETQRGMRDLVARLGRK